MVNRKGADFWQGEESFEEPISGLREREKGDFDSAKEAEFFCVLQAGLFEELAKMVEIEVKRIVGADFVFDQNLVLIKLIESEGRKIREWYEDFLGEGKIRMEMLKMLGLLNKQEKTSFVLKRIYGKDKLRPLLAQIAEDYLRENGKDLSRFDSGFYTPSGIREATRKALDDNLD